MNSTEFKAYKARYRAAIRQVLADSEKSRLDEAAFPAYSHPNPLINWLFWQRLRVAMECLVAGAPYEALLDFGCGSGVMLPFLAGVGRRVVALDVDLVPLERVRRILPLAGNVELFVASKGGPEGLPAGPFDAILALDVLEHVPDLPRTLDALMARLARDGQMVVSGPTENVLYRIGRRLAGPEYSGDYHARGIAEIRRELERIGTVTPVADLYPPVTLFEVFSFRL